MGSSSGSAASVASTATTESVRDCLVSTRQVIENCRAHYADNRVLALNTVLLTCELVDLPVAQYAVVLSALEDIIVKDCHLDIRIGRGSGTPRISVSDNESRLRLVEVSLTCLMTLLCTCLTMLLIYLHEAHCERAAGCGRELEL